MTLLSRKRIPNMRIDANFSSLVQMMAKVGHMCRTSEWGDINSSQVLVNVRLLCSTWSCPVRNTQCITCFTLFKYIHVCSCVRTGAQTSICVFIHFRHRLLSSFLLCLNAWPSVHVHIQSLPSILQSFAFNSSQGTLLKSAHPSAASPPLCAATQHPLSSWT